MSHKGNKARSKTTGTCRQKKRTTKTNLPVTPQDYITPPKPKPPKQGKKDG